MRIKIDKSIVPYNLTAELLAAGVPLSGSVATLPNNGLYIPLDGEKDLYTDIIKSVIDAHDNTDEVQIAEDNLKSEYQNAINKLETIRDAQSLTNEQAIQALQFMAKVLVYLLKYLIRRIL